MPTVLTIKNATNHIKCPLLAAFQEAIAFHAIVQTKIGYIQSGIAISTIFLFLSIQNL